MSGVLLDTHIWLWYLQGNSKLPAGIRQMIDTPSLKIWLSPISLWETLMLQRKGKLQLDDDPKNLLKKSMQQLPVHEAPLSFAIAQRSESLALDYHDPADRFIAATALVYEVPLATVDTRLCAAQWLPTVSD